MGKIKIPVLILLLMAGLWFSACIIKHNRQRQEPAETTANKMKQYWFVMLTKGANRDAVTDTAEINRLQEGHMDNIRKMAADKKLVMAGPFGDDGNWRGIFIFDVADKDEVIELLRNDPAIAAGRLDYEIHPWWSESGTTLP